MGINKNFTFQTSAPAVAASALAGNWATYYVNNSGILNFVHPNGTGYVASTFYPTTGAKTAAGISVITTGNITFTAGVNTVVYGSSGNSLNSLPTILGEPSFWIPAIGPNGQLLSIPTYTRSV